MLTGVPGERGFWIAAFAWEIFNFTCGQVIAFGRASSLSRLLEYHLTRVPISPPVPTCCCCEHVLVGDAIYQLHPCQLRHPTSEVAASTKQGEHANMMQLLPSKNSRRKLMTHLSSPASKLQEICLGIDLSAASARFCPANRTVAFCKQHQKGNSKSCLSFTEARRLLQGGAGSSHLFFATLPLEKHFTSKRSLTYVCRHPGQRKAS